MYPEKVAMTNHFLPIECIWGPGCKNIGDLLTLRAAGRVQQASNSSKDQRLEVLSPDSNRQLIVPELPSKQTQIIYLLCSATVVHSLLWYFGRPSKMALCMTSPMLCILVVYPDLPRPWLLLPPAACGA